MLSLSSDITNFVFWTKKKPLALPTVAVTSVTETGYFIEHVTVLLRGGRCGDSRAVPL